MMNAVTRQSGDLKPMMIHGKWYDMSGFDHPGGPIMLKLGEGRNATAMFEAHHPFTNRAYLERILRQREVKEPEKSADCQLYDQRDRDNFFDWPAYESKDPEELPQMPPVSEFAHELTARTKTYFEKEATRRGVPLLEASKASPGRWAMVTVLFGLFLSTIPAFVRGEWWSLAGTPLAYWICGVNLFHDGSHFALSRNWLVNMAATYFGFWFSSPLEWYHQHVIGHHAYPNVPQRDPDLYHNNILERHTKTLRHKPMHSHQNKTFYPVWMIGTMAMNYLKPIQMFGAGYYNRAVAIVRYSDGRVMRHWMGRLFIFSLCHVWPFFLFSIGKAFVWSLVPAMIVSVCFMICSQVNHLTPQNIDVSDPCYYKHQVLTSHSFQGCNPLAASLAFLFTGGLNLQTEHHLFPTVNHCHLPYLQPMVKEVCAKHNVPYHESSGIVEAMGKYLQHMSDLSIGDIIQELAIGHDHDTH